MTLTDMFFYVALGMTLLFAVCVVVLLFSYFMIYERVNKNFRTIHQDKTNAM